MSAIQERAIALDVRMLTGTWHNTNALSRGIPRIDVDSSSGSSGSSEFLGVPRVAHHPEELRGTRGTPRNSVQVRAFGAGEPLHDWGVVAAPVFASALDSGAAMAFSCIFDLGYADVHVQANLKGGVLVVATFNRFKDDSGRSSYFMREFYYR
jgi:hypothetical protein